MRTSDEFPKREKEKVPTYREEGEWRKKKKRRMTMMRERKGTDKQNTKKWTVVV